MKYTTEEKICILFAINNISATKFYALWNLFGSTDAFVKGFAHSKEAKLWLGDEYIPLCHKLRSGEADRIISKMQSVGVGVTTCFSDTFPQTLAEIANPPYILFYRGNVELLKSRCFAVVGTRKPTSYGRRAAADFTNMLSQHFTIVSGLAYGIDSVAHETTLKNNGKTIAVLAGGLLKVYPAANQQLAERIVASGGLLISEYGYDIKPLQYRFPQRNRLVSGLSVGLLVCQAPDRSGTSSTVTCALEQGKDVFVVPGEIYDTGFIGSNRIIKSMQSVCVTSPADIEEFYQLNSTTNVRQRVTIQLSFDEQRVVDALTDGQMSFDKLVEITKISPADLNFLLANLEIKSIIARIPGNSYRLNGGLE